MALVATDNKHYKNIADAIRGKIGNTDLFKPEDMASGVNEVYEKGREDVGYKKSANGKYIYIDDIHPNQKKIDVALSSDTITDFSNVKVLAAGKNVIPFPYPKFSGSKTINGVTATLQEDGSILISGTATAATFIDLATIYLGDKSLTRWNTIPDFVATQPSNAGIDIRYDANNQTVFIGITAGGYNVVVYPQIERGDTVTAFELGRNNKYYTVNSDGKVDGIETITPEMNILSTKKGITINTEYYADCEKTIENLTNNIISLGGTLDV